MPRPNRSPLYFYAIEFKDQYQRIYHRRLTISEAITACYDNWKALTEIEKQPYKARYEEWRLQYRTSSELACETKQPNSHNIHQTNESTSLHQRDIPWTELKHHYNRLGFEERFLANEYLPLDLSELLSMPIFIVNFQIFCKVDEEDGGQYIPAEMCILRYTLRDGVTDHNHTFIKPNEIPSGYLSSCLEHSKETHQIPLKDFCEATDQYQQIYDELKSFVLSRTSSMNDSISNEADRVQRRQLRLTQPCLFIPANEHQQTRSLLDWLQEKAEGQQSSKRFCFMHLLSIESLIMVLAQMKNYRLSRDGIQRQFSNATYSYLIEERCPYHFHLGIHHCSITRCHAAARLMDDYLNELYVPDKPRTTAMGNIRSSSSTMCDAYRIRMNTKPDEVLQTETVRWSMATASQFIQNPSPSMSMKDSLASPLKQENFRRLFSNIESTNVNNDISHDDHATDNNNQINIHSDTLRSSLIHRKQILLRAIQSIDNRIEELDLHHV